MSAKVTVVPRSGESIPPLPSLTRADRATSQLLGHPGHHHHTVQFYDDDGFLCDTVAQYLAAGLEADEKLVVIATAPHRDGMRERLGARGYDVDRAEADGQLAWLDARDVLARFMVNDEPDRELFHATVGAALLGRPGGPAHARIRAYGEMVDLLWKDGKPAAAIRLEELWNELADAHPLSLLCAYAMGRFGDETDAKKFHDMCARHTHVLPAESYMSLEDGDARLREIAALQQRARALENEVNHRRKLDRALRDALSAQRQSQEELKDFVENAVEGLHWVGPDGIVLWVNRAELELLGYSRDEYVGHHSSEFHADAAVAADILARLARAGTLRDFEARLRCKDGSIKHVLINSNVLWRDGKFVHTRCFTRDISARHHAENQLRLAEERFRSLISASSQVVWTSDPEGNAVDVSPSWLSFTGQSAEQASGWGWLDAVHADERELVQVARKQSLVACAAFEHDVRLRRPDGRYSWTSMRGTPVIDASGAVREWVGMVTDISERRRVDEERQQLLEREQLARDQAETANRMKDEFIAVLSHERRTPLSAIMGWAEALRAGGLDHADQARALDTIVRSAKNQAQLVEDVLDVSRIIAGKLRLQMRSVELAEVVRAAVDTLRPAAESKDILLQVSVDPGAGQVSGDPDRLQQVVWNLLSNAIKFTPRAGRIEIKVERRAEQACVIVRDTGKGIRPEFMPYVFDRFRQADASITRTSGGLGLGLSIVRQLVEMHGGSVSAVSEGEDQGATFTVALPRMTPPRAEADVFTGDVLDETAPGARAQAVLAGIRVLLVDDVADVRDLISLVLTRKGAIVKAVGSAPEALQAIQEFGPHVLVSDIGLPGEDGYELMRKARLLPIESGGLVPAVALTAYAGAEDARRAMIAGYQMHVPKPVELSRLLQVIADLATWSRRESRIKEP